MTLAVTIFSSNMESLTEEIVFEVGLERLGDFFFLVSRKEFSHSGQKVSYLQKRGG